MLYSSEYKIMKYFSAMLCQDIVSQEKNELIEISTKSSMILYILHFHLLIA